MVFLTITFRASVQILDVAAFHRELDVAIDDGPAAAGKHIFVVEMRALFTGDFALQIAIMLGLVVAEIVRVDNQIAATHSVTRRERGSWLVDWTINITQMIVTFKIIAGMSTIDIDADAAQADVGRYSRAITAAVDFVETTAFDEGLHAYRSRRVAASKHIFDGVGGISSCCK